MKNTLIILTLILLLASCRTNELNNESKDAHTNETDISNSSMQDHTTSDETDVMKWQEIQFAEVSILIEEIEMGWHEIYVTKNDSIYSTTSDTAYFDLWPGDWFYDKAFKLEQTEFDQIALYEKISYNMAMNSKRIIEVPFCVIYNWKTFESEWSEIQLDNKELKFMSNEEATQAVINFTLEEFKSAVKEECGIEWYNEIKDIQSIDTLPSELFISNYTFKIVARNSKTGQVIEKFLVFNTPTSS